ncbi:hypothetical protein KKH03_05220 [Patescibacteria group bacterium]|nr:hypothetical protein [Patescibacteria group bacterium]
MKHKALAVVMALAVIIAFGGCWNDPTEGIDETAQGGNQAAETQPTDQPQDAKQPADVAKIVFDIPEGWERGEEGTSMARPIITLADIPAEVEDKQAELERWKEIVPYAVGVRQYDLGDKANFQKTVDYVVNSIGGKDKINQPPDEAGTYTTMKEVEIAGYKAVIVETISDNFMDAGTDIVFMKDGYVGWVGTFSRYDEQKTTIENIIKTIHRE